MIKCPICGAHVPKEVAIEIPAAGRSAHYCSLRCASAETPGESLPREDLPPAPQRILVAVDGSGPSLRATQLAARLALSAEASVELIHAIDPSLLRALRSSDEPTAPTHLGISTEELEQQLRKDAEAQLERCRWICESSGIQVSVSVEIDAPIVAISAAAKRSDLIVIGSRGLGATSADMLGSLSHRVIAETDKPVLVVH